MPAGHRCGHTCASYALRSRCASPGTRRYGNGDASSLGAGCSCRTGSGTAARRGGFEEVGGGLRSTSRRRWRRLRAVRRGRGSYFVGGSRGCWDSRRLGRRDGEAGSWLSWIGGANRGGGRRGDCTLWSISILAISVRTFSTYVRTNNRISLSRLKIIFELVQ